MSLFGRWEVHASRVRRGSPKTRTAIRSHLCAYDPIEVPEFVRDGIRAGLTPDQGDKLFRQQLAEHGFKTGGVDGPHTYIPLILERRLARPFNLRQARVLRNKPDRSKRIPKASAHPREP